MIGALMPSAPDSDPRICARYWIETAFPLEQAAETLAGEQSTGTFLRVPGETDELRETHAARVENIQELDSASGAISAGSRSAERRFDLSPRRSFTFLAAVEHGALAAKRVGDSCGKPFRAEAFLRAQTAGCDIASRISSPAIRGRNSRWRERGNCPASSIGP